MTIGPNLPPLTAMPQGAGFADETTGKKSAFLAGAAVRVTAGAMSDAEGVDSTVEADLRRDDKLDGMFAEAFNLPAPAFDERGRDLLKEQND